MVESLLQSESSLKGVSIVIPCYNEEPTYVTKTYKELTSLGAEVIIVDDGDTMELDFPHVSHRPNMGYGYAIKRGIEKASNSVILTLDGDGQHLVSDAIKIYTTYKMIDDCAMVVGCRWNLKEVGHRWIGRKVLNFLASIIAGHYLVDLNSGMRVFRRDLALGYSSILCDTFSFTTSLTMSMVTDRYKIAYFPINVQPRANGKSRVKVVKHGIVTLYYILWVGLALRTRRLRACIAGR